MSKYYIEDYFKGFIECISEEDEDGYPVSSTCMTNQVPEVKKLGLEYDEWYEDVFSIDISLWTWSQEWFKTIKLICSLFTQVVAIDDDCKLEWYFWMIAE